MYYVYPRHHLLNEKVYGAFFLPVRSAAVSEWTQEVCSIVWKSCPGSKDPVHSAAGRYIKPACFIPSEFTKKSTPQKTTNLWIPCQWFSELDGSMWRVHGGQGSDGNVRWPWLSSLVTSVTCLTSRKKTLKTGGREFWNTLYCFDCPLLPNLPELHLLLHFTRFSLNVYIFVLQLSIFAQCLHGKEEACLCCLQIEEVDCVLLLWEVIRNTKK